MPSVNTDLQVNVSISVSVGIRIFLLDSSVPVPTVIVTVVFSEVFKGYLIETFASKYSIAIFQDSKLYKYSCH